MQLRKDDFVILTHAHVHAERERIQALATADAAAAGVLTDENRAAFDAFNRLVAYVYPTASVARGALCAGWCNWLFLFDDAHDEMDAIDVVTHERTSRCLRILKDGGDAGDDPLARYALSFRTRALALTHPAWLARFCRHVDEYIHLGTLPATRFFRDGETPTLDAYLQQREHDGAVHTAIDLVTLANDLNLPDAIFDAPDVASLASAAARSISFFNDIVSFPKEVLKNKNPNNLVHVLMVQRDLRYGAALREAVDLVNAEAERMRSEGAAVVARHARAHPDIARFYDGLAAWQAGNIENSLLEPRYRSRDSAFAELRVG